jgi:hypothetical protein
LQDRRLELTAAGNLVAWRLGRFLTYHDASVALSASLGVVLYNLEKQGRKVRCTYAGKELTECSTTHQRVKGGHIALDVEGLEVADSAVGLTRLKHVEAMHGIRDVSQSVLAGHSDFVRLRYHYVQAQATFAGKKDDLGRGRLGLRGDEGGGIDDTDKRSEGNDCQGEGKAHCDVDEGQR